MSIKITAELVKELRDGTGVSVMQCKNALEEANGDLEKALIILKKKSSTIAMKKADRNAKDGIVVIKESKDKTIILILHTETDFVAKNEDFIKLADTLSNIAINDGIGKMKEQSVDLINAVIQKVGEKIELGKVEEIIGKIIGSYVHNNKSASIVVLEGGTKDLARDLAMHIAAMKPAFISKENITEEDKNKVVEVFEKEVNNVDKAPDIKEKILEGKITSYFKEITLMDQNYIKNPDTTISKLLSDNNAKFISFIYESIN